MGFIVARDSVRSSADTQYGNRQRPPCFERFFRPAREIAAADRARLREREKPVYFPQYYQRLRGRLKS
jgi:hypothetical protein